VILKILQVGEPVLRNVARPLKPAEIRSKEIRRLIENMRETMRGAPGVGLAAPQIGEPLQLAVVEDRPEYYKDASPERLRERERNSVPFHVIINPNIRPAGAKKAEFFEGCLSLAGFTAVVARSRSVHVDCLDENGKPRVIEASGWYARILQHEIDHLRGCLYIDRMHSRSFCSLENFGRLWKEKSMAEIRKQFGLE